MSRLSLALAAVLALTAAQALGASAGDGGSDPRQGDRLKIGIGDRLTAPSRSGGPWTSQPGEALAHGLKLDFFELWLPRGWKEGWVERKRLGALVRKGITPVVVHYYFGDFISRERVESQRKGWYSSMWRMAQLIRMQAPVLVVLEPEFNIAPPPGETAITERISGSSSVFGTTDM